MNVRLTLLSLLLASLAFAAQSIQWAETGRWEGCGTLQTEYFILSGTEWSASLRSLNNASVTLTLFDANTGYAFFTQKGSTSNGSFLASGVNYAPHQVYLQVTAPPKNWSLQFRQYVSAIEAFNIHKRKRQPQSPLTPFAAWAGEGGETLVQPVHVPSREWKLTAKLLKAGSLTVTCTDKEGNVLADFQLREPGKSHTWLHTDADVRVKITSQYAPWNIKIEMK